MKHIEHYFTKFHDCGASRILRPSAILTYMQETANLQFEHSGLSLDRIRDEQGLAFVLSRIAIKIHEPIHAYESIDVATWTCESKGYAFNRCFSIEKDGKNIVESVSLWALLKLDDMKMERCENFHMGFENEPMNTIETPLRFRIPLSAALTKAATRKIMYSDIDYNMHMNNTHYPDLFCDYISHIENKSVTDISVSWLHESRYGKDVDIYICEDKNIYGLYYFRLCDSETQLTLVDARIATVDL